MYGCFVTEPEDAGADLGVVFFHNAGYSTACGHGTIALVTWALESGGLEPGERERRGGGGDPPGPLGAVTRVSEGGGAHPRFPKLPPSPKPDRGGRAGRNGGRGPP